MTARRCFASIAAVLGLYVLSPLAMAPAAAQPANAEQLCTPDVIRLCSDFIPDRDRIVACMIRSKPQLSPGCATVFNTPAPQASTVRTARANPPRNARGKPAPRANATRVAAVRPAATRAAAPGATARPVAKRSASAVARNRPLDITRGR